MSLYFSFFFFFHIVPCRSDATVVSEDTSAFNNMHSGRGVFPTCPHPFPTSHKKKEPRYRFSFKQLSEKKKQKMNFPPSAPPYQVTLPFGDDLSKRRKKKTHHNSPSARKEHRFHLCGSSKNTGVPPVLKIV